MNKPTISIVLPTYNEAGTIVLLIKTLLALGKKLKKDVEIILVDDNSTDHTGEIAKKAFIQKRVTVYIRKKDRGLATAIKYGIHKSQGEFIIVMDTDFNHDPKVILAMFQNYQNRSLVIGSRYVPGGGMQNTLRYWLSYGFNFSLRILLGHQVHDNLSGFFLIRRSDLLELNTDTIFQGFGDYFIRLIYRAHLKKYILLEVPVYYKNRVYGISKSKFLHMFLSYTQSALQLRFGLHEKV